MKKLLIALFVLFILTFSIFGYQKTADEAKLIVDANNQSSIHHENSQDPLNE